MRRLSLLVHARRSVRVCDGVRLQTCLQPRPRTQQLQHAAPAVNNTPASSPLSACGCRAEAVTFPIGRLVRQLSVREITSQTGHLDHGKLLDCLRAAISASSEPLPVNSTAQRFRSRQAARPSLPGIPSCSFSLSGTRHDPSGSRHSHGSVCSGTTCLGPNPRNRDAASHRCAGFRTTAAACANAGTGTGAARLRRRRPTTRSIWGRPRFASSPSDIASWPATARITRLDLGSGGVHIELHQTGRTTWSWPDVAFLTPGRKPAIHAVDRSKHQRPVGTSGCIQFWRGLDRIGRLAIRARIGT